MENTLTFLKKYKKRSLVKKINDFILLITLLAMIFWMIFMYVDISKNGVSGDFTYSVFWDIVIIFFMASASYAGVISVVASNNKMPLTLLFLSSIATIYKLMYALIQIKTGQQQINSSVIIGQSIVFFTLILQVVFWIKWNKETSEGKFITQVFTGWRTLIAISIISLVLISQTILSAYFNGGNTFYIFMDVLGSGLYTIASILMAFGNIFCFLFFLLSDFSWLYWTIKDLSTSENALMLAMALTTLIQIISYSLLAITGFIQWFMDDYKIVNYKIIKLDR